MFSLGSTDDTLTFPSRGITTKKLVFPWKGNLATWKGREGENEVVLRSVSPPRVRSLSDYAGTSVGS